jgi:hypothetical protein
MLKLLFKLLLRPELISMHVQGYADLLSEESGLLMRYVRNRFLVCAIGFTSLVMAVMWGGVALMLWSALPTVDPHRAWVLWAFPLAWLGVSLGCWVTYRMFDRSVFFPRTLEQIQLDMLAIRQARKA